MATNRWLPPERRWVIGLVAGFILALSPSLGGWSNGEEPAGNATHTGTMAQQPHISIQHGRLTLTLQGADVHKVIVEMGQLAGIPVIPGPIPERRGSAELTDIELDEGFCRLLRLKPMSYSQRVKPSQKLSTT